MVAGVDQIVAKPPTLAWDLAGGLSLVGQGAFRFLEELQVTEGETLLIHAAAGGVGTVASQLALLRGATVIGTAGEGNHDYLRSLGVIPVSYGDGLLDRVRALAPNGVQAALDAIGGSATEVSVELVADRDRVGTLVDVETAIEKYGIRRLVGGRSTATLGYLAELAARGTLRLPTTTFPLDEVVLAHQKVQGGHVRGKVVLTMG
ncbi:alcohol dehydrogenase zinc-binding domain-containing protein [Candidatus Protofrankia californiensis]|uniref:Alcohol dehydrogenase zinc-binding domain-containing protein n=1 Tax=Candidatus Protofrankia californiensis TaxID=1839754 RepID=A0A1C3PGF9_9ACTN|nr:alcohol dehydrogenase zinc-binding domain-containing protein [Candidatus Protofrankia californiensis]